MKKILFFTLIWISISCFAAQDSLTVKSLQLNADSTAVDTQRATKQDGDAAYIKNDYSSAIQIYEHLLNEGESAEVYYNLGNSYYKSNEIAKAILNYERALLLQPGNEDIRANLEIARAKAIDKVEIIPEIFFVAWIKQLINTMSVDSWAAWGIASFILFLISMCFFFFSKQLVGKKIGFFAGIFLLIMTVVCNVFAYNQKEVLINRNKAIIMTPSVTVRSTPSDSGTSLFILHEGSKVIIKDNSMKEWKEITLEDGKVGWVPATAIEVI